MRRKLCPRCNIFKTLDKFHKVSARSLGVQSQCKKCVKRRDRVKYLKNKEAIKARVMEWRSKNPKNHLQAQRKWRDRQGDAYRLKNAQRSKDWRIKNPELFKKSHRKNSRYHSSKRRCDLIQRTPKWADTGKIKEFYKNCPPGMEVDHILPLCGKLVSGLHVHTNLQYLTKEENSRKCNRVSLDRLCMLSRSKVSMQNLSV